MISAVIIGCFHYVFIFFAQMDSTFVFETSCVDSFPFLCLPFPKVRSLLCLFKAFYKKRRTQIIGICVLLFYKIISRKLAFRFISERMKYFMDPAFPVCSTSKAGFYLLIFLYGATAFTMIQIPIVMIISGKVLPRIISILISKR